MIDSSPEIEVLVVGEPDDDLTGLAITSLMPMLRCALAMNIALARQFLQGEASLARLIVLVSPRPGQFSEADVASLRELAPLAKIWRLLSSWCEGETRTGRPPCGCTNFFWHQWEARIGRQLLLNPPDSLEGEGSEVSDVLNTRLFVPDPQLLRSSALPATVTLEERELFESQQPLPTGSGLIAIVADRGDNAAAITQACRQGGYQTIDAVRQFSDKEVTTIVWDCDVRNATDPACVEACRAKAGKAPILAVVTFPRIEDFQAAHQAGVTDMIAKPFAIGDLLWKLRDIQILADDLLL